jgi:2-polyprenyl-3-methyl-5-hydroxy-6-metoxy-1,4-benzoquinol methylase
MEWDAYADGWDDDVAARTYARAAFESLQDRATRLDLTIVGADTCDFGCGTGLLTERLAEPCERIDAVDASPAMLAVLDAKIERRGWTHVRTMTELPRQPLRYDLVVCSSVCAFLDDYAGTVRRLVERLRPGGLFVQWDWELNADDDDPHGLEREEIRKALTDAGLSAVTVEVGFNAPVDDQTMSPLMGVGRKPG